MSLNQYLLKVSPQEVCTDYSICQAQYNQEKRELLLVVCIKPKHQPRTLAFSASWKKAAVSLISAHISI